MFAARATVLEELGRDEEAQTWRQRAEVAASAIGVDEDDFDDEVVFIDEIDEVALEIEEADEIDEIALEVAEIEAAAAADSSAGEAEGTENQE